MKYERQTTRTVQVVRLSGFWLGESNRFHRSSSVPCPASSLTPTAPLFRHLLDCLSFPHACSSHFPSESSLIPSGLCQNPGDQEESLSSSKACGMDARFPFCGSPIEKRHLLGTQDNFQEKSLCSSWNKCENHMLEMWGFW